MLMPVAALIVVFFGALGADYAHLHLQKQDLVSLAGSAANDLATEGLDQDTFRGTGAYVLRDGATDRVFARYRSLREKPGYALLFAAKGPDQGCRNSGQPCRIQVTVRATVPFIFAKAIPFHDKNADLTATSSVTLDERGPQ